MDYIILDSLWKPVLFWAGGIVIYWDEQEAKQDAVALWDGCKLVDIDTFSARCNTYYEWGDMYIQKDSWVLLILSPGQKPFLTFKKINWVIDLEEEDIVFFEMEKRKLSEAKVNFTIDEVIQ